MATGNQAPTTPGISGQWGLPGIEPASEAFKRGVVRRVAAREWPRFRLFFALFPGPEDAKQLFLTGCGLHKAYGLTGTPLSRDRLHVTLTTVGNFVTPVPDYVVTNAIVAARRIVLPPVPVTFERVLTFPQSGALVLRSDCDTDARIAPLRQSLTWELRKVGLHPEQSATPHMTMQYDSTVVSARPIKPLRWTATHFALILSHIGYHHHERKGEWALTDLPLA